MRRSGVVLYLTILATLFYSCAPRPVVTRRYRIQTQVPNASIAVRLTAFCLGVPVASAQTTLMNLADRGQASLIRELGAKSGDAGDLLANLGSPIVFSEDPGGIVDHTVFERRVVFSIDDQLPGPADRITQARIRLTIMNPPPAQPVPAQPTEAQPAKAEFKNWTQFATKYEKADLGSLKFTQTREIGVNVSGGTIVQAGSQATASNALEENLQLMQRYISVTGTLTPDAAELIQEGSPGTDVTGNIVVDLTIQIDASFHTDTFNFKPLFDGTGKPKPPDEIVFTRHTVTYVPRDAFRDVKAQGTLTATVRHVIRGDDTIMEGDDIVQFRRGSAQPIVITLIPKELLRFNVWMLVDAQNQPLHIDTGKDQPEAIYLASFDEALALREYLAQRQSITIAGRKLWLDPLRGTALDKNTAKSLQVWINPMNW